MPQIAVGFYESFLLGIRWNALCFWAKIPECVKILYFISVWLFSFGNRGESVILRLTDNTRMQSCQSAL